MLHTDDALRVMHDPLSYYRPWLQRAESLRARQRSALNGWLVRTHALRDPTPLTGDQAAVADRLLAHWPRLPATAWLMACAKQRRVLMGSRVLLGQPPVVHAFLRLGFAEASQPLRVPLQPDDLLAWGGDHLQRGLRDRIPDWLADRLRLCFSGLPPPPSHGVDANEFDMTCFWSAWNHAADLPGTAVGLRR